MNKIIILLILIAIPSLTNAFSLSLGDEKINVDAEYESGRVNSESDGSVAELTFSYDPTWKDRWSLWSYNTARREKNSQADISFEDFAGGGIKYAITNRLSGSYGLTGHYVEEQWDWLHSWRLKLEGDLYAILLYQHDIGLESDYLTKGIVGYKVGEYFSVWHKRERRASYRRTHNGIGFHYDL